MAVNFYLDNKSDKNGDNAVRVSISLFGQRFITSTGYKISPGKWDNTRQRVKKGCANHTGVTYNAINSGLARIAEHFATYESECITKGLKATKDEIRRQFLLNFGKESKTATDNTKPGLLACLDMFIKEESINNGWTKASITKFHTLKNHIQEYGKSTDFDGLDESYFIGFSDFLRTEKDMRNNTLQKAISYYRWFLKWATRKGYNDNTAFQDYTPKFKTVAKKVHFLSWDELMKVYRIEIPNNGSVLNLTTATGVEYEKTVHDSNAIAKTRDIFCFCCFTSLRYSDAINLKWSDIGKGSFTITTVKTTDTITIDLNKYALSILDKYRDYPENNGFVFPRITNQRMNIYLKELCEICGINQPITETYYKGIERIEVTEPKYKYIGTHAGRRTFICNALILGIPPQIVMKWTGHSDYKAMKPYIDITNEAKAEAMAKFNEL